MGQSEYNSSNSTGGHWDTTTEFTSFDYNGFTLGNNTMTNQSGQSYVNGVGKAGGSKGVFNVDDVGCKVGLTGGDITPIGASVGTKQGFSIIKFTTDSDASGGDTLPHSLNAPTCDVHIQTYY